MIGNAFRHGAPPITVRLWRRPTRLEATVTDCGRGFDDPLAGYVGPGNGSPPAGAGLWVARQACDTLEAFRTPAGFTVHLTTVLNGPDTIPTPGTPTESAVARAHGARADAGARYLARRLQEGFESADPACQEPLISRNLRRA